MPRPRLGEPLAQGWEEQRRFEFGGKAAPKLRLDEPLIRVMALHALLYCERLFFLKEVEEIRVADAAVYAGRRLHDDVVPLDDETPERSSFEVSSDRWGIFGKVDALWRRDGVWVAYEHERGRCRRGPNKVPLAWASDRIEYSVFRCRLENLALEKLHWELNQIMAEEDDLLVIPLCGQCASKVLIHSTGDQSSWSEPPPTLKIV